jgi:predicted Zn-dependent protease with MMP-like domain
MLPSAMIDGPTDIAAIQEMAERAFDTIPDILREQVADIAFHVLDLPDDETCVALGLNSPYDLLGLYEGIPIDQQSVLDVSQHVDRIFLYRLPLIDYAEAEGAALFDVVKNVLIHEIGHHFGFSDAEMEAIEYGDGPTDP